jgi:2-polyprenyl-3-methyl-5-hydroxy-6-metoxy-1,4-benzoquinol methylase
MRKPVFNEAWPQSWKDSYEFNEMELWGGKKNLGYTYSYLNRRQKILDAANRLLAKGAKILDVAGAHGNFSLPLAEQGYNVVWNDIRAEMEGYVKEKYESGNIEYRPGNCFDLAEKYRNAFDAIIATEIIEHVAHPDKFLKGLSELLKPGGYILLSTPNGKWLTNKLPRFSDFANPEIFESQQFKPDGDGHIFLLHPDELRSLAEKAGLKVVEFELINTPLLNAQRHVAKLLHYIPKGAVNLSEKILTLLPDALKQYITYITIVVYQKPL